MQTRKFKIGQYVQAAVQLINEKTGEIYLNQGDLARIMVIDPALHEGRPYGLRKEGNEALGIQAEHITKNYFAEDQLCASPQHPAKADIWTEKPEQYFSHPSHPRHNELKAQGFRYTPQ